MTFAEGAGRLAGVAGAVLGWSPGAFWRATPAELAAVVAALTAGGAHGGGDPPDAATMARLREAFPDG
ncbi:phage tail assembly chaperone [Sphingomonas sp. 1P08PE]|uniref:phage tail assembly chaperone n=1 Tax=Sphingomonas sp. 1P08PE TaxID=554122 RepID=UPI0039A05CFB